MSNTFTTGEQIARVAAAIAAEDLGVASLVHTDLGSDFRAGGGKTVHIPVPGATTTSTRPVGSTEDYALGAITEKTIPVTLETEAYSVVPITLDEATLAIEDLSRQVIRPQSLTVANHVADAVAALMAETVADESIAYDADNPKAAVIRARARLRARGVSADRPLLAVAGADVFADLLLAEAIDADGKVAGVEVHEDSKVPADTLVVFVREAYAAAIRAPQPPEGATYAASVVEEGMALTHMRALNGANGVTNSIVTTFVGVEALPLPVVDHSTGDVTLLDGGGAVAINTTGV